MLVFIQFTNSVNMSAIYFWCKFLSGVVPDSWSLFCHSGVKRQKLPSKGYLSFTLKDICFIGHCFEDFWGKYVSKTCQIWDHFNKTRNCLFRLFFHHVFKCQMLQSFQISCEFLKNIRSKSRNSFHWSIYPFATMFQTLYSITILDW